VPSRKKTRRPKGEKYPGDLRRDLIDAALKTVEEDKGAGVLTLRGVARRVGVSHAAPHRHFVDKKALLAAVGEEGLRDLRAALTLARSAADTPRDRLRATGVAFMRFALDHASHFRVMFGPEVAKADSVDFQREAIQTFNLLKEAVNECLSVPIEVGAQRQLGMVVWSALHGLAELALNGQIPPSVPGTPEALADLAMRQIFFGSFQRFDADV
jgi:AcrR family transcriptional regulator